MIYIKFISAILMLFAVIDHVLLGIVSNFAVSSVLLFIGAVLGLFSIFKGNNPEKIRIPVVSWVFTLVFSAIYAYKLPASIANNTVLAGVDIMHWIILAALATLVGIISTIVIMIGSTNEADYESFES